MTAFRKVSTHSRTGHHYKKSPAAIATGPFCAGCRPVPLSTGEGPAPQGSHEAPGRAIGENLSHRLHHLTRSVLLPNPLHQRRHRVSLRLLRVGYLVHQHPRAQHVHDVLTERITGLDVLVGEFEGSVLVAVLGRVEGAQPLLRIGKGLPRTLWAATAKSNTLTISSDNKVAIRVTICPAGALALK